MELIKILLLLSISIACSLSQQQDQQAINAGVINLRNEHPEKICKGSCSRRNLDIDVNDELSTKECACFPLDQNNTPVPEYILKNSNGGLRRTVIYLYTVGNKTAIYIPNQEKQALFVDLTLDDGDVLRPLASQDARLLTAEANEPMQDKNVDTNEPENENGPVNAQSAEELFGLPSDNRDRNEEALKHILEDDNILDNFNNFDPASQQELGLSGASTLLKPDQPLGVIETNSYDNRPSVDEPKNVIELSSDEKYSDVYDIPGNQQDFEDHFLESEPILGPIAKPSTVFEPKNVFEDSNESNYANSKEKLYSQRFDNPKKQFRFEPPKDIYIEGYSGPQREFGINSNEKDANLNELFKHLPQTPISFNRGDQYKPQNLFEQKPFAHNKDNIYRPESISGFTPDDKYLQSPNSGKPFKSYEPRPSKYDEFSYDVPRPNYEDISNENYLPQKPGPHNDFRFNLDKSNKLGNNIDEVQEDFKPTANADNRSPYEDPRKSFGYGGNSNQDVSKPQVDLESNVAVPQRKFELEFEEDDEKSARLFKSQPNIRCRSGICKLYIYCSRDDCLKYLLSLSSVHTHIHKHPHLENTFIATDHDVNRTKTNREPFMDLIRLEDVDRDIMLHNIRDVELGDENPRRNQFGRLRNQQVPRSIPISLQPLSDILQAPPTPLQQIIPHGRTRDRAIQYFPKNPQILPSRQRDLPYQGNILYPKVMRDQYYSRRDANENNPEVKNIFKDLLLFPSRVQYEGVKKLADKMIPDYTLRRSNVDDVEVPVEIEIPPEEDDIKIKIIGGQPAISSGTPMQIKARLGDII